MSNSLPRAFRKALFPDETVLAVARRHPLWFLEWNTLIYGCITFGGYVLYKALLNPYKLLILTDRRIIGSVKPRLLTKDRVDLAHAAIDNLREDETIMGNLFGWVAITIESRSQSYTLTMVSKGSAKRFKQQFSETRYSTPQPRH